MSAIRYTVHTLASGQPRAYADSRLHVRVTIEELDPMKYKHTDADWVPRYYNEVRIQDLLERLQCGFMRKHTPKHGLEVRLDWLKPIDPYTIGDPNPPKRAFGKPGEQVSHIWEFQVTSPFTD